MKNRLLTLCYVLFLGAFYTTHAQQTIDEKISNSPIYDYKSQLTNTDTIPEFSSKRNKLRLEGVIYESDGVTPVKDAILFISHADEDGNFDLKKENGKRYVNHRGWIKTDADGRYTFYTFVPGYDRTYNQLQEIYPLIKLPGQEEFEVPSFLFESDPLLSKLCRKRLAKKGDITRILNTKMVDGVLVARRDIIIPSKLESIKLAFAK